MKNVPDNRMKAINQIRAKVLEANNAFSAVLRLRDQLVEAKRSLAFATANPAVPPLRANRLMSHIADIEAELVMAERYCRQINPDRLRQHDEDLTRATEASRQFQERELAEYTWAVEINRQIANAKATQRLQDRLKRQAEESALLASANRA